MAGPDRRAPAVVAPDPPGLDALAAAFGLDRDGAEVVRSASRHVVRFPASRVRTFAVPAGTSAPRHEAAVAALLADAGVPAARCLAGPAPVDGWVVTAWREVAVAPEGAPDAAAAVLGALAARLHAATGGLDPRGLLPCDPIGAALAQVEAAVADGRSTDAELGVLRATATRLEGVWDAARERARTEGEGAVVHGDLHHGNVVVGRDGPVLVDLELAGWGPRAFDAAPTVAFVRWYGAPESDRAAFDDAYGSGLCGAAEAAGLDQVWALWAASWAVANRHLDAAAEDEATVRLATLATGALPRPWRLR